MIFQKCNKINRIDNPIHPNDIDYLTSYYKIHGKYPPFTQVLIETRTDCNNQCKFCPQSHYKKPLGIMSNECYRKIIDNLYEINYNGRVAMMISNEPLLEKRLVEMIRYAKNKSQRFFIDITTNGRLLSLERADELFAAGLDNININDYREDRDINDCFSNNIEIIHEAYGNNPKITFKKRSTDEQWPNYAGILKQEFDVNDFGFCNFPFRKLTIAFNGDVLLCCNDFSYKTKFGNVMDENIEEIWNNQSLNHIRQSLLKNKRINLCASCNDAQDYNIY